ncbi:MAG: DUF1178 family protein [Paracoccus sp. (in: a-proteobacteria)]|uniref:DUF1178 family protein n=1 Tax=Paracoccus sp. TaxID=267 RepID=UPI0026DF26CD|nr:DUF1178 family protein [Paracoccus sp. (in: a-proteobacteria)]MDO5633149.1 DUF1178 family protein [Paracoccus sp. (in: a-proteobacteria)]
MIRYDLRCDKGHDFDGWFRSSEGFDAMRDAGQIACTICGSARVDKALMAPAVPTEKARITNDEQSPLDRLRQHVEANSDYVGPQFAAEARAMHHGDAPHRAIHGEATAQDARALIEEGVPVAPLPFIPRQKTN